MLKMLLLLLLLHTAYSTDFQPQKNFTIKHVDSCPDVGYYLQREMAPNSLNPGPCFLCFCQRDGMATCWRREDWRCDVEKYHHHHVDRRDTRIRRALGLGDIFFRDATRDVFNKNMPEQCKPFESSFSDGCPPVDWCIGCTVCDCDANGHWDCHVLSFCDPTTKKPPKKRKGNNYRRKLIKKTLVKPNKTVTVKPVAKPTPKIIRKVIKKSAILNTRSKRQPQTQTKIKRQPKNINRNQPKQIIKKKAPQKNIIKKSVARKPVEMKNKSNQIILPSTPKFAQAVVQKVLEAVQQLMRNDVKKGNSSKILNAVEKKRINSQKVIVKKYSTIIRPNAKQIKGNVNNNGKKTARNKRDIYDNEDLEIISVAPAAKDNTTILDKIIPIQQMDMTTENPRYLGTLTIENETLTTNPTSTIVTESTLYYDVLNDRSNKKIDSTTKSNWTTTIANTSEPVPITTTFNATSEKSKEIINITRNIPDVRNATDNIMDILNNMTSVNYLKFKKWHQLKLLKEQEKHFNFLQFKEQDIDVSSNHNLSGNDSFGHFNFKPKFFSQDIKRIVDMPKINKIRKIIKSPRLRKDGINATNLDKNVSTLQNIFKNIFNECHKDKMKAKSSSKKYDIFKYIKNLFKNLLTKDKSNTTKPKTEIFLEKQNIINMLCENIRSCNLNPKDRKLLDAKVTQLGMETDKVLKIIKIIKGILHLVDIPMDTKDRNTVYKQKSNLKDDINKLNIILRDSYINVLKSEPLSQTQATQIDYIKKNTQQFIYTIANFGKILNEVITLLKKNNRPIEKRTVHEIQRHKYSNSEAFKNLKNLLIKYDIIQNSFFKKIYGSLAAFETKLNKDKQKRTSIDKELKNMANIDNFSRNIVTNLRKLTQLAQNINSRTKRETMRDNDAVEYLLMLMEYLLKQNYSLDAAPVNDGIDMLIEAIKNAPDIKLIRKKVLNYTPAILPTRTVSAKIKKVKQRKLAKTTTFKKPPVVTSKLDDPKFVEPVEEERDYEDKYSYTRRSANSDGERYTKVSSVASKIDMPENLKESDSEAISDSKVDGLGVYNNSEAKIDNLSTRENMEENKYDIFNADIGDFIMFVTTSTPSRYSTPDGTSSTETSPDTDNKKIEWIDESYEKDNKVIKEEQKQESTKPPAAVTRTKKATSKAEENISTMTREIKDVKGKKTTSAEDLAYKKQMDLLNSLDYVTEKVDFDVESKDMEDPFPSYFG